MVCGRRLSSLRLNLIGLGLFFFKCNPQKGEKGCLRGLIPMHESGVQGRFRVDFLVGPLDLKLPPLPINAKTHLLLSLEPRVLSRTFSRLIFKVNKHSMQHDRLVNEAVLRPLAHGDEETITADADLHVPREAVDAAQKNVRRAVRQNRCCEPVSRPAAGLLVVVVHPPTHYEAARSKSAALPPEVAHLATPAAWRPNHASR